MEAIQRALAPLNSESLRYLVRMTAYLVLAALAIGLWLLGAVAIYNACAFLALIFGRS